MQQSVGFRETEVVFSVAFSEDECRLTADFGEVTEMAGIPKEYGLITYDHNRTITVS